MDRFSNAASTSASPALNPVELLLPWRDLLFYGRRLVLIVHVGVATVSLGIIDRLFGKKEWNAATSEISLRSTELAP
jgi:hypothetical protein